MRLLQITEKIKMFTKTEEAMEARGDGRSEGRDEDIWSSPLGLTEWIPEDTMRIRTQLPEDVPALVKHFYNLKNGKEWSFEGWRIRPMQKRWKSLFTSTQRLYFSNIRFSDFYHERSGNSGKDRWTEFIQALHCKYSIILIDKKKIVCDIYLVLLFF